MADSTTQSKSAPPAFVRQWVDEVAGLTQPGRIHWCDGSEAEAASLRDTMLARGDLVPLNPSTHPYC